jgi:hypothetical protein
LATDWVNFPTHLMQCSVTDIILQWQMSHII